MKTRIGTTFAALLAVTIYASVADAQPKNYRVVSESSEFLVHVGRAGLFKAFGHDHRIRVERFSGAVAWDPSVPESAKFTIEVDAASLSVADKELSDDDRNDVQTTMGTEALALDENPTITFTSTAIEVEGIGDGEHRLRIAGELALRGIRRKLEIPLTLSHGQDGLVARGTFELRSKQWGVPQISALGGSVKTTSDLKLEFRIVAVPES